MNVDKMRAIDYYLGIPLTFIVTLFLKIKEFLAHCKRIVPSRILFMELSEMGSVILADPAMCKAKRQFNAELFFVIFSRNEESLHLLNTVRLENVFSIRENNLFVLTIDVLKFLFWVRRNRIDTVVDMELFSRFTALLTGLSGAVNRVGFYGYHNEGLYRGDVLTHKVAYNPHIHIAKNFIALINALSAEKPEMPYSKTLILDEEVRLPKVQPSTEQQETMQIRIREYFPGYTSKNYRLVLINPHASELLPQRCWMPERYVAIMKRILEAYSDVLVLIVGSPSESKEAEELQHQVNHKRCVNFSGAVRLSELPVLYTISTLMITNDSGPGHFSAITDMPTFVLFGPETPKLYGSLGNATVIYAGLACSPCVSAANHRKTPCQDNVCLQVITVDEVFDLVKKELDNNNQPEIIAVIKQKYS